MKPIPKPVSQSSGPLFGSGASFMLGLALRVAPSFTALALLASILGAEGGCAARPQTAQVGTSTDGKTSAQIADAQDGVAIPFSLCRSFGTAGTPCYPTNVDIGSRVISACRERQRGHCELSGPRHTMACLLAPLPDGKTCGESGVCKDGSCITQ